MNDHLNKHLLATFADLAEALAAQSALEAEGIPCDVGDLAQVPAPYLVGAMGGLGRSTGIWVLEVDAERAAAVVRELRANATVDEGALAAEALAAGVEPGLGPVAGEVVPMRQADVPSTGRSRFSPMAQVLAVMLLAAIAVGLISVFGS